MTSRELRSKKMKEMDELDDVKLTRDFRNLIRNSGFSATQIGMFTGVSPRSIERLLYGQSSISATGSANLVRLLKFLGVPVEEFFTPNFDATKYYVKKK